MELLLCGDCCTKHFTIHMRRTRAYRFNAHVRSAGAGITIRFKNTSESVCYVCIGVCMQRGGGCICTRIDMILLKTWACANVSTFCACMRRFSPMCMRVCMYVYVCVCVSACGMCIRASHLLRVGVPQERRHFRDCARPGWMRWPGSTTWPSPIHPLCRLSMRRGGTLHSQCGRVRSMAEDLIGLESPR